MPQPTGQRTSPRRWMQESWGELRKVQWPTLPQVWQGTLVVFFVTVVFALYFALLDQIIGRAVVFIQDHF